MQGQYRRSDRLHSRKRRKKRILKWNFILPAFFILVVAAIGGLLWLPSHQHKPVEARQTRQSAVAPSTASSSATKKPVSWLTADGKPNELPILMFHYVAPDAPNANYMTPENFDKIARSLSDAGYRTLTADEALAVLTGNKKPSNKMVWLTFDDGHENNYTYVYPILKKYKLHATFNMVTGTLPSYTGTDATYITAAQMKEMARSGRVDFQSHTVNHPDLATLDAPALDYQLSAAKKTLDKTLHQDTQILCYPSGKSSASVEAAVRKSGYKLGLIEGEDIAVGGGDLLATPRLRMSTGTTAATLLSELAPAVSYNKSNTKTK